METRTIKIKNMDHLAAEIQSFKDANYVKCNKEEAILKIIFKETDYDKSQQTIYFK